MGILLNNEEIDLGVGNDNMYYKGAFNRGAKAQLKKVVEGRPREFDGNAVKLHFTKQEWQSILKELE